MSPGSVNALKYRGFGAFPGTGAGRFTGPVRSSAKLPWIAGFIPRENMTEAKFHVLDGFPRSVSPSSHATEADGLVFLTGQFGRDLDQPTKALPEGIRAQTDLTLRNMSRVLAALDLSLGHVLRVRVFLTHFKCDYETMNEVYAGFFPSHARPARTCIGVTDLVRDALIEIDCIAKR
jgi:reactive intermediate/imine deaminase